MAQQGVKAHLCAAAAALAIALLYFRHIVPVVGATAIVYRLALPLVAMRREGGYRKRLRKDALLWLEEMTMSLKAGASLTTATLDLAARIIAGRAKASDAETLACWRHCAGLIHLHYPIGFVYRELARKLGLPELRSLAALIGSAVDTGANLPQVFIRCAEGLRGQMESLEILEASLASRRWEGSLLAAAPAAYTALLRLTAPDYVVPLFTGKGWMVACLVFGLQLGGAYLFFHMLLQEETSRSALDVAGFQEEVAFHIQAGLSLSGAWQRAAYSRWEKGEGGAGAPGSRIAGVARQLALGMPFAKALELLAQEEGGEATLTRLADILRQNYHMGSGSLATLLTLEAKEARQRHVLRQQAKDARKGTTLLFPMVLLLLSALILTAGPAMLSM